MSHPYGKSFTRWFYPLIDDSTPTGIVTDQTPTIYIYESQPSRSQGSTNAIKTISAWTWDAGKSGWYYTVSAINDPQPDAIDDFKVYWELVTFVLEDGQQSQTVMRSFEMERVTGHAERVNVTDEMLRQYFPQLDSCSTENQRIQLLSLAIEEVKSRLKDKGFEWARISRPDRLSIAIAHKVLYMIMLVQLQGGNDKYAIKYNEFKATFTNTIDGLILEYDSNKDGLPDTNITPSYGTVFLIR